MRDESAAAAPARPAHGAGGFRERRDERQGERPAGREGRRNPAYAALDLGTNNCRLLIAEPASSVFRVIDAFSRIVRLGEGLGSSDRLSEAAIERTVEALRICRSKMQARGVRRAKIIATEACRLAVNGAAFVERVRAEVGLDLEIVDRQTEAYLAVTGCAALADPRAESVVIFDIGGGSTEIAWLDGAAANPSTDPTLRIRAWDSLPVGVVTLAERHGGAEVTRLMFEGMVEEVVGLLAPFAIRAAAAATASHFHLLGTSGTVTTIAAMHLRLVRYERRRVDGLWMSEDEVASAIDDALIAGARDNVSVVVVDASGAGSETR